MNLIDSMKWRYAVKKFDTTKKVSNADLETIKEAINLAATSYGLQPFKVLIVENKEIREKLKPVSWGQAQITDASHLLVFCNQDKVSAENIDSYIALKSKTQGIDIEHLKGYGDFMKSSVPNMSADAAHKWTKLQTYIALGNALNMAASLEIDSCPIEGFDSEKYDEILGLTGTGLSSAVVLPIGYRSSDDETQFGKKVRKSNKDLFAVV